MVPLVRQCQTSNPKLCAGWLCLLGAREGGRAQNGRTGHLRRWAVNQSMMIRFEICQIITLVGMYAKIEM